MTKDIVLYDKKITINGRFHDIKNGKLRFQILLYTPLGIHSFKVYKALTESHTLTINDLLEYFYNFLTSIEFYLDNKNEMPKDIITVYERKYIGYKKLFDDISPTDIIKEFEIKHSNI